MDVLSNFVKTRSRGHSHIQITPRKTTIRDNLDGMTE